MKVLVAQIVLMNNKTSTLEIITKVFDLAGKNVDVRARTWRYSKIRRLSSDMTVVDKRETIKIVN